MIALWIVYSALIGLLVCAMGFGLQRVATALGRPTRFIWLAALVVSFAWPAGVALRKYVSPPADSAVLIPFPITVAPAVTVGDGRAAPSLATRVDGVVIALWLLATAALIARLAGKVAALRRSRATWTRRDVGGVDVRLSMNVGPAVVGIRDMDVVVPEWILALDQPLLELVLRHEEEHRAARDPYLLFAAAIAVVLMPWNVALWWQARRLRFAVELDCDARVLRAHPRPERYGMLLLTIAQRRSFAPGAFAPMLSEPSTQLEERINAMRTPRIGRLSVFGGAVVACVAFGVGCALQSPDNIAGPRPSAPKQIMASQKEVYFEFQVEQAVAPVPGSPAPRYPDMLRSANVEGEVLAQFVVDEQGAVDLTTLKVLKSTHDLFSSSVARTLPSIAFKPALVGGRPVKQLVQMPFQFKLSGTSATSKGLVEVPVASRPPQDRARLAEMPVAPPTRNSVLQLQEVTITAAKRAATPLPPPSGIMQGVPAHFEFQVAKPATPRVGNPAAHYPDMLRSANVEGEVLAQFVVGADGRVDVGTFKVLKETHPLFTQAVKNALPTLEFSPAEVEGKAVRQLIQMPFTFSLPRP